MAGIIFGILNGCKGIRKESIYDSGNAGIDLYIRAGQVLLPGIYLHTGVKYVLTEGYELQLRPRSSLYNKFRLITPISIATLDPTYRGEILVIVESLDWEESRRRLIDMGIINNDCVILKDVSLFQLIIAPYIKHQFIPSMDSFTVKIKKVSQEEWDNWDKVYPTIRGMGGFGSTGHF